MPDHVWAPCIPSRKRRRGLASHLTGLLAALAFLPVASGSASGQSEAPTADALIELRLKWLRQIARQGVANQESELISAPRGGASVAALGDPSAILKELRPVLSGDYDAIRNRVSVLASRAKKNREEVQRDWVEACRQRDDLRLFAERQQSEYGFNFDANTPVGLQLTPLDGALVVWTAAALAAAWRLRSQERRLINRRARRAAMAAVLLGGLTAFSGCGTTSDDRRSWAEREEASLAAAIKDASAKADAATAAANARLQAVVDGWANLVTAPTDSVDALLQREEIGEAGSGVLRDRLREVAFETQLAGVLAKDADELRNKSAGERSRLSELVASSRWRAAAFGSLRMLIAASLFGLAIAPYWSARRARRAAVRLASRTCPRCFRRDTLKVEKTIAEARPRYRGGKARAARPAEETDAEEPERQGDAEVRCTRCGLRMKSSYLRVPRLCFPTVGVRSSGKTHMLVTAYDRIRKRTAPTAAIVQPAPSGSDNDKRFDRLIEEILHRRGEAGATDLVLPDPVLVHLKDRDPAGANPALINLFDYSGELINPEVDVNQLKATAVRMDGFMLFLDPTQLYGDGANVTLDEQLGMLDQFLAHMRKERQVPVGGAIPVPVAVCIPKFDLLLTENPIGGQAIPFIRHLLHDLNPPPRQVTLETIKARSDLVEEMLPLLFTGTDLRSVVEGYFGKQVMFFPMSSVSLYEHELGIRDLSRRTIAPFGVAEPLVWLMYMHGYDVFG